MNQTYQRDADHRGLKLAPDGARMTIASGYKNCINTPILGPEEGATSVISPKCDITCCTSTARWRQPVVMMMSNLDDWLRQITHAQLGSSGFAFQAEFSSMSVAL